jgi:hypothetical protein
VEDKRQIIMVIFSTTSGYLLFGQVVFTNTTHVCLSPSNEGKMTCALTHALRSYILWESSIDVVQTMKDYP